MQFVRDNKFTSFIIGAMGLFGANYVRKTVKGSNERKWFVERAKEFGHVPVTNSITTFPRYHVILNKKSGSGSIEDLFKDEAAPILHLGGLDFDISPSESPTHFRELVATTDFGKYDGVIIVGGSGSVQEATTALLNRSDSATVSRKPIGVIPTGHGNSLLAPFFDKDATRETLVRQSALGIVEGHTSVTDVLKVDFDDADDENTSVYALNHYGWGVFGIAAGAGQERRWPGTNRYDVAAFIGSLKGQYSDPCICNLSFKRFDGEWVDMGEVETTGLLVSNTSHWNMADRLVDTRRGRNDQFLTLAVAFSDNSPRSIIRHMRAAPLSELTNVRVEDVVEVKVDIVMPEEFPYDEKVHPDDLVDASVVNGMEVDGAPLQVSKAQGENDNTSSKHPATLADIEASINKMSGKAKKEEKNSDSVNKGEADADLEEEKPKKSKKELEAEMITVPVRSHAVYASVDNSRYYSRPVHIAVVPAAISFFTPSPLPKTLNNEKEE
eukprot:m.127775 g.127775  ORF g.127775 m.127775 type:complete len:497 (+) comp13014_c6_seq1:64-1554(+)